MNIEVKLPPGTLHINVNSKKVTYYDYYAVTFSDWETTKAYIEEVVSKETGKKINIPEEPYHHGNSHFTLFFDIV